MCDGIFKFSPAEALSHKSHHNTSKLFDILKCFVKLAIKFKISKQKTVCVALVKNYFATVNYTLKVMRS